MLKNLKVSLVAALMLTIGVTASHAYPGGDIQIPMTPFWQFDDTYGADILGCTYNDTSCKTRRQGHTIQTYGCTLTSMAMIYKYYGFHWMPDANHKPSYGFDPTYQNRLGVGHLNNYLSQLVDISPAYGGMTRGFNENYDLEWYKTTTNFYYNDEFIPWGLHYRHVIPNYNCEPMRFSSLRRDGTTQTLSRSASCFTRAWSLGMMINLDNDLADYRPDIMQIKYSTIVNDNGRRRVKVHTHFVVIGGYDISCGFGDLCYRVHNPGQNDNVYGYPKSLSAPTEMGHPGVTFLGLIQLYRLDEKSSLTHINTIPSIYLAAHSPVELQVSDPDGNMVGYDPESGNKYLENPMSRYYLDAPFEPDYDEVPDTVEPTKILSIAEAREGNYIFKIIGTGSGPYTIDVELIKSDGTPSLVTQLTGTATPTMTQTYRITYSPTGDASISQSNQAPTANAGSNQIGEQSYDITLDGSASSDPDGDPLAYTWSFASKPAGSNASLSNSHAVSPTFTPDLPGTYALQLVVTDHFTDSAPSTVSITTTPLKSRISATPNLSSSLSSGSGFITFDISNIGRIAVSSGLLNLTLADPSGAIVSTGSQPFSVGVGGATTVNVPVNIPSLKLGNYTLTYTQTDETKPTNASAVATLANSVLATTSFDKIAYRVREIATLTANVINSGKFNLDNVTISVSAPDAGYTGSQYVNVAKGQTVPVQFEIPVPANLSAGKHAVNIVMTAPGGGSTTLATQFMAQQSALVLGLATPAPYAAGNTLNVTLENQGSLDTSYVSQKLTLTDSKGNVIYQSLPSGAIMAGEKKNLAAILLPGQLASGAGLLSITIQDQATGNLSYLNTSLVINGLQPGLVARTDKDVYMSSEAVTSTTTVSSGPGNIENATLDLKVTRFKKPSGGSFSHYLPKASWLQVQSPGAVAVSLDGIIYVISSYSIWKLDSNGNTLAMWGGSGSGDGLFSNPEGIAVGPDGSVYVVDSTKSNVQKFDGDGNFIGKWGGFGSGNGKLYYPKGITVGPDGFVYVADTTNNRIEKFDGNGNFMSSTPIAIGYGPRRIAVDADGYLYVTDGNYDAGKYDKNGNLVVSLGSYGQVNGTSGITVSSDGFVFMIDAGNSRIKKFDSNGNLITLWGSYGSGNGQFNVPLGIAAAPGGYLYVTDNWNGRIQKFDLSGTFVSKLSNYSGDDGQFYTPSGVVVAVDGSLYVLDANNNRVQEFDAGGNFVKKWGSYGTGNGQLNYPTGIALGPDGSLYVTDTHNNRIQKFTSTGSFITKWGSSGSGNGQFMYPSGVAIGADGSVYVADTNNNRIQKFDSSGNYIAKWGSYGSGNGQFNYPYGISTDGGGYIYVTDSGNSRIQKFDSNGSFIAKWGSQGTGNGQLYYPQGGVAVGADGSVYIADWGNNRIQKFDANGNYLAKWGGIASGSVEGQFDDPKGVAIGPDASVYVADSNNNRVQRMMPFSSGAETIFETTMPVAQPASAVQDFLTNIGNLNVTGNLNLEATIKNNFGQTIATSEYPFSIVNGNMALALSADKKAYKPGETITVSGQIRNLAATAADNMSLIVKSQQTTAGAAQTTLYSNSINLSAGGSYPFTFTTTAGSDSTMALIGTISQNSMTLAEATSQYQVISPAAVVSISGPDTVNKDSFNLQMQIANTGRIDANLQYVIYDASQNMVDSGSLALAAGETRAFQYSRQLTQTTTYSVYMTGDVWQSASKTVTYGEAASVSLVAASVYPEGTISVPVTLANTGSVDETVTVAYNLSPSGISETRTYFIPRGGNVTDTLAYTLSSGAYQLNAYSSTPAASTIAQFSVKKDPDAVMTSTPGSPGKSPGLPVYINVTNNGYNSLNGTIALAVMSNSGKAVWRGETQVSSLASQRSQMYTITINPSGILPGAYATTVMLYGSSGQELASNQVQVRVPGAIFEITSLPANPSFTPGKQAVLSFAVKNTGNAAGTANLSVLAADMLSRTVSNSLLAGEQKTFSYDFTVPEDEAASSYSAKYALTSATSQGSSGDAAFNVAEISFGMTPSLDKQVYANNETAVLTLSIEKQSQFEDGDFIAIIRYGAYHDMKTFTSGAQASTLIFNVPLGEIAGDRLFYGVYFPSGKRITQKSLRINTPPVVSIVSPASGGAYSGTFSISASAFDGGLGIARVEYQVDGGAWKPLPLADSTQGLYSNTWTPELADNGGHAIRFRARDNSGNMSAVASVDFTIQMDTTPPVTTMSAGSPKYVSADGTLYASPATLFSLSASDDMSGVARTEYQLDGGAWTLYAPFTIPGEGSHTLNYRSTDIAGNTETMKTQIVIIDAAPPATALSSPDLLSGDKSNMVSPSTAFTLITTDDASGVNAVTYSIDNGTWQNYTDGFSLAGLAAGAHSISFRAVDNLQNEEPVQTVSVKLIVIEAVKAVSADPAVLVGFWADNSDLARKQADANALKTHLSSLGVAYYLAPDMATFTTAFRSGRFSTYILIDVKEPLVGEEIREAVRYGDGLIYIKTKPDADPFFEDLFGMSFTGKTISYDLPVSILTSPISNGGSIQTRGKIVVGTVQDATAQIFGTATDRQGSDPAIVFNQYGQGRVILFAFDPLAGPDQALASILFVNSLQHVRPLDHAVRALDSAPIKIRISNSSEPVDVKLVETLPDGSIADTPLPQATQKDNVITWEKSLAANEKSTFKYYLNLPDMKGDYTTRTALSYGSEGYFKPYEEFTLTLTVQNSSTELLQVVVHDLQNMLPAGSGDAMGISRAIKALSSLTISVSSIKDAEANIRLLVDSANEVRALKADTVALRLKLDELLRIWEKKWYLLRNDNNS